MSKTKLVIKRSKWGRGARKKFGSSLYCSADGKMCCLGFEALRRGHTVEEITDKTYPKRIDDVDRIDWSGLVKLDAYDCPTNTDLCQSLTEVNDDPTITNAVREKKLIKLFAQLDPPVIVEFVP